MKPSLWRTTAFRLTVSYAVVLALTVVVLLASIYWKATDYFGHIGDTFVTGQARALLRMPPEDLPQEIQQLQFSDTREIAHYGLFDEHGTYLAGNVTRLPEDAILDGVPRLSNLPGLEFGARSSAQRVANGQILVIVYDAKTLSGIGDMLLATLLWAGSASLIGGLIVGALMGLRPLRRVQAVQITSTRIARGNLSLRLPLSRRRDELDALSSLVNQMMDEVEHLLGDVRSVGNNLAHDLRTPLNRLRGQLHRLIEDFHDEPAEQQLVRLHVALEATEQLMSRFRAIQRIAEIDSRHRRSGMRLIQLETLVEALSTDFRFVAEELEIYFHVKIDPCAGVHADYELLMEAMINLLDNALKFTPPGGTVTLALTQEDGIPVLSVHDTGPGIPAEERDLVLHRFGRCARDQQITGGGLGLAIVAAVVRLHGFKLSLQDASPGLGVKIKCLEEV